MSHSLSRSTLLALERKYRALTVLREERESHEAAGITALKGAPRDERLAAMKIVATEFPGALRELEALTSAQLRSRAQIAGNLANSDEAPPLWLVVVWEFHCITKSVLAVRERVRRKQLGDDEWHELQVALIRAHDKWSAERLNWLRSVDAKTINRYLTPENGRMVDEVWQDLSARHNCPVRQVQKLVFGGD